eukprot:scaffold7339_cov124-Isochrysis_galbana.AAC.5
MAIRASAGRDTAGDAMRMSEWACGTWGGERPSRGHRAWVRRSGGQDRRMHARTGRGREHRRVQHICRRLIDAAAKYDQARRHATQPLGAEWHAAMSLWVWLDDECVWEHHPAHPTLIRRVGRG